MKNLINIIKKNRLTADLFNKFNTLKENILKSLATLQSAARKSFVVPTTALCSVAQKYRNVNDITVSRS